MRLRIDEILVRKGFCRSRSQAKDQIGLGWVFVDGVRVDKASRVFNEMIKITVESEGNFVGRGALKLKNLIEKIELPVQGKVILDVGASTGGFTDYLLSQGVEFSYTVDVGSSQLAEKLLKDNRVENHEKTDIRDLKSLDKKVGIVVVDVSFISLKTILEHLGRFLDKKAIILLLFKPQFEVGKEFIGKDGVVKKPEIIEENLKDFETFCETCGYHFKGRYSAEPKGKKGNQEFWIVLEN